MTLPEPERVENDHSRDPAKKNADLTRAKEGPALLTLRYC